MTKKFLLEKYGEFEVETKITYLLRNEIENTVAKIYGGRTELTEHRLELEQKTAKLKEVKDVTQHALDFFALNADQARLENAYKYATLKAVVVKAPIEIKWLETAEEIDELYEAYERCLKEDKPSTRYQELLKEFNELSFKKKKIELF